jgi:hypothetical protein
VFSAADIIEALGLRRRLKSIRPDIPGQLPPGWQSWLDGMSATPRAVVGAAPQDVITEFVHRELAQPPPRVANLNRWQAFATLWRQQWQGPEPEERGLRWFAAIFSAILHLVLGVLLLFLAFVHLPPPPGASAGETVVQAEFIGEGTPKETGGGAPEGPAPVPSPAPATPAAPSAAQQPEQPAPTPPAPQPPEPVAAEPEPQPQPAPPEAQPEPAPPVEVPPAPQPLEVTQVPEPDTTFVLPPPRPREAVVPERQITVPEARQPTETISRVQRPTREVLEVERATPQVTRIAPTLRAEEQARLTATPALQPSIAPTREISVPAVRAQIRDIPMPSRGTTPGAQPGTSTSNAPAPSGTSSTAGTTAPGGQQPAPGSGTNPAAQPGAGTTPNAPPGAWPSPSRGDDWGVGSRNRPGGTPGSSGTKPGVFKSDGTPNLVPETPSPGQNAPGSVEAHIADLDRAGQWLKRPPYDYTPTTFDKYWRPRESLLQEWVRRGIKTITIPIPGTGKRLQCAVSLLALGGACGLTDPNVNEQPASARPPPDIPFKPWLQEDNGSIRTPPPGARTTVPASGASVGRPPGS